MNQKMSSSLETQACHMAYAAHGREWWGCMDKGGRWGLPVCQPTSGSLPCAVQYQLAVSEYKNTWSSAFSSSAGAGVLPGVLWTGLTQFRNSLSWLLECDLDEEIWPCVRSFPYLWLWWAVGSSLPGSQQAPDAHRYLLWKGPVGLWSPFASDSCGLLWLPSLTQYHKCLIIYLNSSSFTLLFWELHRICVNHLSSANNCPHVRAWR